MNWDDLRIFLGVARKQKFCDAAIDIRMDETTIARRIKRLELELGQTLFERSKKGNSLTLSGKKLLEKCEDIDLLAGSIIENEALKDNKIRGTIRISAAEGFGATKLAELIAKFHAKHPFIEIELVSGSGFLSLSRREADVAIGLSKSKSKLINSSPLLDYELGLYAAKDSKNHPKSMNELIGHTFIGYVDDLIYAPELRYFEEVFPNIRPKLRCTSIIAKRQLVESGIGFAILPTFMANSNLMRIMEKEISIKRTFWISAHKGIGDTKRYRVFETFLRENLALNK